MKSIVIVCLAGLLSFAGTARAERQYRIVSKSSGLVLTAQGQFVFQELRQSGNWRQLWVLQTASPGSQSFRILNVQTGLAMEVIRGTDKSPVQLSLPATRSSQLWIASYTSDGSHFKLLPILNSDKAMDVPGATRRRTHIQIYSDNSKDHQLWRLERAD